MTFTLTSSAVEEGAIIPNTHTCSRQDVSPPLQWSASPKGTRSFALLMDDPDAPISTWAYWVIFNSPGQTSSLREGVPPHKSFPTGEQQVINDIKRIGYDGLCPPPGKPHRYYFKLYAFNAPLKLQPGATKKVAKAEAKNKSQLFRKMISVYEQRRREEEFFALQRYGARQARKKVVQTEADVEALVFQNR